MRIVVLHAGGIGDLVLAETLLGALRERFPWARIVLLCRADVAPVARLYADPPDVVCPFGFNPYRWALPGDAIAPATAYLETLPREPIDLFISAELRPTWLSDILAAALQPRDVLFGNTFVAERDSVRVVLRGLALAPAERIRRLPEVAGEHELDRYARLAEGKRRFPALRPLRRAANGAPRPVVIFPLGTPALKRWPLNAMMQVAHALPRERDVPPLLVASDAERDELEALAAGLPAAECSLLTGSPSELETIADAIANAAAYVGIDSGLAHLAAAYGIPGVTIYGGGTWPSYAPWAPRTAGVVAPLPCFGCGWDCAFDHAYCIDAVSVDDVSAAFVNVTVDGASEPGRSIECASYGATELRIIGDAARAYRAAQDDRAARFQAIVRLRDVLARYARRARLRQQGSRASFTRLSSRLAAAARRINERVPLR